VYRYITEGEIPAFKLWQSVGKLRKTILDRWDGAQDEPGSEAPLDFVRVGERGRVMSLFGGKEQAVGGTGHRVQFSIKAVELENKPRADMEFGEAFGTEAFGAGHGGRRQRSWTRRRWPMRSARFLTPSG